MKVFLAYLRPERIVSSSLMPLGILYIAGVLQEHGFEVEVFDCLFEDPREGIERARRFDPDVVGVSFLTTEFKLAREWIPAMRRACPRALLGAGGAHITAHGAPAFEALGLDFAIAGEGELSMLEYCRKARAGEDPRGTPGLLYRDDDGVVRRNPPMPLIENLDDLPFPARNLLDVRKYLLPPGWIRAYFCRGTLTLFSSRGCPAHCTFCDSHVLFGRGVRRHSVRRIIEEIEGVRRNFSFDSVYFMDDTFTLDARWLEEYCREVKKLKIAWGCQTRVTSVTREMLGAMRDSGCVQVDYGVESGSDKVLKAMKKGTTAALAERAFDLTREAGLRTYATMIVGFPEEKAEDVQKSVDLVRRIKPDFLEATILTPYPGTEIYDAAVRNRWIDVERLESLSWDMNHVSEPILKINFSARDLMRMRRKIQNANFFRNYVAVFAWRNLPYIAEALWSAAKRPRGLLRALIELLKTRNMDVLLRHFYQTYQLHCYSKRRPPASGEPPVFLNPNPNYLP